MERFFMTQARAVAYLLRVRRAMADGIDSQRTGDTGSRLQELDTLDACYSMSARGGFANSDWTRHSPWKS